MKGVTIKIFYGYRYYDQEYEISKWHYDYETIESQREYRGHTGYAQGISNYVCNRVRNIIESLRTHYSEE